MAKVRINGEVFEYDFARQPLEEMLALEKALGVTYGQWSADRQAGSARAIAGLTWLIWRRNGREVDFARIESGEVPLDLADWQVEDPQEPPVGPTKEASSTTGGGTSGRSRKS